MTEQETRCFRVLDAYARSNHDCFVAEFWMQQGSSRYAVCFRPATVRKEDRDEDVYACKYIELEPGDVLAAAATGSLPRTVADQLDAVLPLLTRNQ